MTIKRIAAVSLLTISFLSVGTTYALVDTGGQISNWYQNQLSKSSDKIGYSTVDKMIQSFGQISKELKQIGRSNGDKLRDFEVEIVSDSRKDINAHNEYFIQQLQVTTETLKQQNSKDMETYSEQTKEKEIEQVTQDTEDILNELLNKQN